MLTHLILTNRDVPRTVCCCYRSRREPWPEHSRETSVAKREGSWLQRPAGPLSASSDDAGAAFGEAACLLSHQSCTEWVEKQLAPGRAVRREWPGEAQLFPGGCKNQKELGTPCLDHGAALRPCDTSPPNHCTKYTVSGMGSTAMASSMASPHGGVR